MSRVHLPPGWVKFWWFADCFQCDNQRKLQKKRLRFFSERIHAPADSFISKNEGMNQVRDLFRIVIEIARQQDIPGVGELEKAVAENIMILAVQQNCLAVVSSYPAHWTIL
jgi:hypothetical protein